MSPGVYNGGVNLGGGMNVTMESGIYYMKGGDFVVANGVTLTGNGVMIYTDTGRFSFQGGGRITLTPPTDGDFAGITLYQDRNSTRDISIANGSTTTITGTIYAASCPRLVRRRCLLQPVRHPLHCQEHVDHQQRLRRRRRRFERGDALVQPGRAAPLAGLRGGRGRPSPPVPLDRPPLCCGATGRMPAPHPKRIPTIRDQTARATGLAVSSSPTSWPPA